MYVYRKVSIIITSVWQISERIVGVGDDVVAGEDTAVHGEDGTLLGQAHQTHLVAEGGVVSQPQHTFSIKERGRGNDDG